METNALAVIPARGGSKGIPRKNLRPVAGKPLIYYSISACLSAPAITQVVVSTDDEEIALFAERFGARVLLRPDTLADDVTTLDPVICHTVVQAEQELRTSFDVIVTVQPTSPLISPSDIDAAVLALLSERVDSVISVEDDTHLRWRLEGDLPVPEYRERVNRQSLPRSFRETGAVIACTRAQLDKGTRVGARVHLLEIPGQRSVDIDTYADLALCEFLLSRKRIVFAVVGYDAVGLGHVYRVLSLAHDLVAYDLQFVCEEKSDLVPEVIGMNNYRVHVCENGTLAAACLALQPDLVINDILDTESAYIEELKAAGAGVINFEDLGSGSVHADLVINALYPHSFESANIRSGTDYFCLRDEFLFLPPYQRREKVSRVLVTFGGVDEGDLTRRCIGVIAPYCLEQGIFIDIITGPGYQHRESLSQYLEATRAPHVNWADATRRISDYMLEAELAITSGGRTVLELSALTVPALVICQNERETTHTFAQESNGVVNLGHREDLSDEELFNAFKRLVEDDDYRRQLGERMRTSDLRSGKQRVIKLIKDTLELCSP